MRRHFISNSFAFTSSSFDALRSKENHTGRKHCFVVYSTIGPINSGSLFLNLLMLCVLQPAISAHLLTSQATSGCSKSTSPICFSLGESTAKTPWSLASNLLLATILIVTSSSSSLWHYRGSSGGYPEGCPRISPAVLLRFLFPCACSLLQPSPSVFLISVNLVDGRIKGYQKRR